MMELEVRHLRMLTEIREAGNVTRAAARLHLTQSAVSHQLLSLEARLGTPLFHRVGRRMVPTPAGERVLQSASRILEELASTEADVRRLDGTGAGVLRVCAQCNTGYHWLPPLLQAFHKKHPHVEVSIVVDATPRPVDALLEGRLDLAIVTRRVRNRNVRVRPLFLDEHAAIVAPGHRFASRRFVMPADFADEQLFLYASSTNDSFILREILSPAGVHPARVSFVQLTEAILEMVKAGLGISVMQTWAIEPAIRAGDVRAVPITRNGISRQWSAATIGTTPEPPYLADFISLLASRAMPALSARRSGRTTRTASR